MGLLRLLLALGVVRDHRQFFEAFFLVKGGVAVIFFYIISGFYMTLVIRESYSKLGKGWQKTFLLNRALRLYPAYWAVLLFTIVVMAVWNTPTVFTAQLGMTAVERTLSVLANTGIIGLDVLVSGATLHWRGAPGGIEPSWQVFPVFVAWTVAVELTFYVLAAYFIVINRKVAFFAIAFAVYLRVWFDLVNGKDLGISVNGIGYSNTPWGYHFFGVDLIFFMLGYLAYEIYVWLNAQLDRRPKMISAIRWSAFGLIATLLLEAVMFNGWQDIRDYNDHQIFAALPFFTALVPMLFILTKRSKFDNFIGQFSYPVYLCHVIATDAATKIFGLPANNSFTTLAAISVASSALVFGIDLPIDSFRHRLTQISRARVERGDRARVTFTDVRQLLSESRVIRIAQSCWSYAWDHPAQTVSLIAAAVFFPYCFGAHGDASRYFQFAGDHAIASAHDRLHIPFIAASIGIVWQLFPFGVFPALVELIIISAAFAFFANILQRSFESKQFAIFGSVTTLVLWQIRFPSDPIVGPQPFFVWTALLLLAAIASMPRNQSLRASAVYVFASAIAAAATPISWAVLPIVSLIARDRRTTLLGIGSTFLGALFAVLTGPGLRIPSSIGVALRDITGMLVAMLPASFRAFSAVGGGTPVLWHNTPGGFRYVDDRFVNVPPLDLWGWLLIAVVIVVMISFFRKPIPFTRNATATITGISLLLSTALFAPFTWGAHQQALAWGQAPESIIFAYFGIGLLCTSLVAFMLRSKSAVTTALLPAGTIIVALALSYGNARADRQSAALFDAQDQPAAHLERAASAGFFAALPRGATALSLDSETEALLGGEETAQLMLSQFLGADARLDNRSPWKLQLPSNDVLVAVAHVANAKGDVDKAYGFTVFAESATREAAYSSSVKTSVRPLRDGWILENWHYCQATDPLYEFVDATPKILYGSGFYGPSPTGYGGADDRLVLGTRYEPVWFPKMYMSDVATATVTPVGCKNHAVDLLLNTVANGKGLLTIANPSGIGYVHVAGKIVFVHLILPGDRTSVLTFRSNAPAKDMTPIDFRYEHDRPHKFRVMIEPEWVRQ